MIAKESHTELNERIAALVGVDMLKLGAEVAAASSEYDRQKNKVEMLEHGRKALISRLVETFRKDHPNSSETRLEHMARASDQYKNYLELVRHEKDLLADLRAQYYQIRSHQESVQLQLGFAKSEMYLERG